MGPYEPIHSLPAGRPDDPRPDTADAMFLMDPPAQTVLERRLALEKRHPDVIITPPGHSASGQWEAHWPVLAEPVVRETCAGLLNALEARTDLP